MSNTMNVYSDGFKYSKERITSTMHYFYRRMFYHNAYVNNRTRITVFELSWTRIYNFRKSEVSQNKGHFSACKTLVKLVSPQYEPLCR